MPKDSGRFRDSDPRTSGTDNIYQGKKEGKAKKKPKVWGWSTLREKPGSHREKGTPTEEKKGTMSGAWCGASGPRQNKITAGAGEVFLFEQKKETNSNYRSSGLNIKKNLYSKIKHDYALSKTKKTKSTKNVQKRKFKKGGPERPQTEAKQGRLTRKGQDGKRQTLKTNKAKTQENIAKKTRQIAEGLGRDHHKRLKRTK